MTTYVFSDISHKGPAIGYCFALVRHGRPYELHAGQFLELLRTTEAEICSLAMALEQLEPCERVVAFTDVEGLRTTLARSKSDNALDYLRWAISRHGSVHVEHVDRDHPVYLECDSFARGASEYDLAESCASGAA